MKFERINSMPQLKKEIIAYLFEFITRKGVNEWWLYKGEFKYEGVTYNLECKCKYDNQMFSYKDLFIEQRQIIVDIDDMVAQGLLH